jgi:hypothetical protein
MKSWAADIQEQHNEDIGDAVSLACHVVKYAILLLSQYRSAKCVSHNSHAPYGDA